MAERSPDTDTPAEQAHDQRDGRPDQTPSGHYEIVAVSERTNVERGDPILVDLFIIGNGELSKNRLDVLSHPQLTTPETAEIKPAIAVENGEVIFGDDVRAEDEEGLPFEENGGRYFYFPEAVAEATKDFIAENCLPIKRISDRNDGYAPLQVVIETDESTPRDDFVLDIVFTYESGGEIRQDTEEVDIHIKTRPEELEPLPAFGVIAGAVIALLSLLYTAGFIPWVIDNLGGAGNILTPPVILGLGIVAGVVLDRIWWVVN